MGNKTADRRLPYAMCLVLLSALLCACSKPPFFEQNHALENGQWNRTNVISCKVTFTDTVAAYDFYLNARNGGGYKYNNLWIFFHTTDPAGKQYTDTIECPFADKSGKWLGTSASGGMWDNRVLFRNQVLVKQPGVYEFRIEQAMRDSVLDEIYDAGLRIEQR